MSTTVRYKGSTLATADNQTKTLKTAGKYLEDDVTIIDVTSGGSGSAVSVVDTLDSHGGTIREITAVSLEGDTVTPSVLGLGYTAHNAAGDPIVGTANIDGGSSPVLQSKTKSYTPSETTQSETVTADAGYDGLSQVNVSVGAVSSSYVGSGVTRRSSSDLSVSGTTVTALAGYYASNASVEVSSGGDSASIDTKTVTASNYPTSIQFTSMKGQPKWFALRSTSQISSSGSTTYYYIIDMIYDGNSNKTCEGNCFRIGSTRRVDTIASGYSWSYSGTTLTITSSASSRSASPGAFNNGYELVYVY